MDSKLSFDSILTRARELPRLPVAVVEAAERTVLEGVADAWRGGYIDPVLVGNKARVRELWTELGDIPLPEIHVPKEQESAAEAAIRLVTDGRATALMKGALHTEELLKAVLRRLRTTRRVSHVFLAELPTYHKPLFITDAAVNIAPDLTAKADIIGNAVAIARMLGIGCPKVAALSAVEAVKPAIRSTVDAACLSKMAQRHQIEHAWVEGPLAFDNAISAEAALTKGIDTEVAGDVDILLVPDLDAGNILVKDLTYLAQATMAGLVVGAKVPVILTSRSDPPRARLVSTALVSLLDAAEQGQG